MPTSKSSSSSEKRGAADVSRSDVTRQAELVAMEYLKSCKCTQTLDAMMQSLKPKSSSVVASELFAADLDSKKRSPQEFKSVLEYMVSESSRTRASESSAGVPLEIEKVSSSKPRHRRSSSVSSESGDAGDVVWSKEDISRLRKAIKQTSSVEDKNERWREIATLVGNDKSKKHCYVKYKELKEEKKAGGSGSRSSSPSSASSSRRSSEDRSAKTKREFGQEQATLPLAKTFSDGVAVDKTVQHHQSAPKKVSWGETSASLPRSTTVASELLEMEDVEDFDSVQPTQSRSVKPSVVSSNSGARSSMTTGASGASVSSRSGVRGGRVATLDEVTSLQQLLFSSDKKGFSSHWDQQGFSYTDVANLRYGLVQHEGGPCGVLAVVQAYVLRFMLERTPRDWQNPDEAQQKKALVAALTHIVHQAAGGSRMPCTIVLNERSDKSATKRKFMSGVMLHTTANEEETRALLLEHIQELMAPKGNGVVLFVASVVLSKGAAKIQSEMDHVEGVSDANGGGKLIGGHDYCTQEMVNLLLCGQASSNVFDGHQLLEGASEDDPKAVVLKGVSAQASVGFLSLFEAYEYLVVGSHLKSPRFNVWVVCSESHYSVLFAEPELLQDVRLAEREHLELFYYDGLANQDEVIRLSVHALAFDEKPASSPDDLVPPLNLVIRTKWPRASVDWNDTEPLL